MSRRRRFGALALIAAIGVGVAYQAQGATDVASIGFVGWWSKRPAAMPTKTDTGFEIASGVDGTESVAAFRMLIRGDITSATLVLTEESDTAMVAVSAPKLQVCPTDTPWLKINGGKYADAPKPSCDSPIALTRNAEKLTWSADVSNLLAGPRSELSLMVVPAPDSALLVPPTFVITFTTPRIDATGTPDVVAPSTGVPKTVVTSSKPAASSAPASAPRVTPKGPVSSPTATVATTAPPTTAAPAGQQAAAPTPARFAVPGSKRPAKQWGKLVLLIPLSLLAGAAYTVARKRWVPTAP